MVEDVESNDSHSEERSEEMLEATEVKESATEKFKRRMGELANTVDEVRDYFGMFPKREGISAQKYIAETLELLKGEFPEDSEETKTHRDVLKVVQKKFNEIIEDLKNETEKI